MNLEFKQKCTTLLSFHFYCFSKKGQEPRLNCQMSKHIKIIGITCGTCATIWRTPMTKSMIGGGKIHSST